MISACFKKWHTLWQRAADVKKTEWLLHDLKLVGVGWLVETLDQLLPSSLPETSQIRTALTRAVESAFEDAPLESGVQILDNASGDSLQPSEAAIDMPEEPNRLVPRPPAGPRSVQAPARHNMLSKQAASVHEQSSSSVRADSPELTPPDDGVHPPELPIISSQPPTFDAALAQPDANEDRGTVSTIGGEARSAALHALGAFLERQQQVNRWEMQRLMDALSEARNSSSREIGQVSSDMRSLRDLQLEHAKLAYSEASKRQRDAVDLDQRVTALTERLAEADQQMAYLKDTLYSVLTIGQGGPIKAPPSKKVLKPIKGGKSASPDPGFDAIVP